MNGGDLNLKAIRPREARLERIIGKTGYQLLLVILILCGLGAVWLIATNHSRYAYLLATLAIICYMPAMWWHRQLSTLPVKGEGLEGRLSAAVLSRLKPGIALNPSTLWHALKN